MKMNREIETILNALNETPRLLKELIDEINPELYKEKIIKGKWSIHEHATHIAVGDIYGFQKRLEDFRQKENPSFEPLSGDNFDKDFFIQLDLIKSISDFFEIRQKTIELAKSFDSKDWDKLAIHPEYKTYTPYIMLRHLLMHDHNHLYKIEDMGFGLGHVKQ
jgi:DinB superfamily